MPSQSSPGDRPPRSVAAAAAAAASSSTYGSLEEARRLEAELDEARDEIRLDFVESIFGNAGDPLTAANDAALDAQHWSGHTGCVILAPHLVNLTKKELGLPPYDEANERQRADSMCWKDPSELYNDGSAFKLSCRDDSGVMVTLIADNYYGYCKKEVKTQISYAANLMGKGSLGNLSGKMGFVPTPVTESASETVDSGIFDLHAP